jgi:hypothetical protein
MRVLAQLAIAVVECEGRAIGAVVAEHVCCVALDKVCCEDLLAAVPCYVHAVHLSCCARPFGTGMSIIS